jgi:hypothetical protein
VTDNTTTDFGPDGRPCDSTDLEHRQVTVADAAGKVVATAGLKTPGEAVNRTNCRYEYDVRGIPDSPTYSINLERLPDSGKLIFSQQQLAVDRLWLLYMHFSDSRKDHLVEDDA